MDNVVILPITRGGAIDVLDQLADRLQVDLSRDCQRHELQIPEPLADEGRIIAYEPNDGIDALIIDATFCQDVELALQGDFPAPMSFYTSARGHLNVSSKRSSFTVSPLQSSIHGGFTGDALSISFSGGEQVICMIIFVHKQPFFKGIECEDLEVPSDMRAVIEDMSKLDDSFLFQEIYHLPIVNALNEIIQQENIGLLNSTFATAKIYETLFLQLEQYKRSTEHPNRKTIQREEKLMKIRQAESVLMSQVLDPPTIPELSRMVGINQQDLKCGFKELFGETINQYLTERRLEQAGILIQGGKMSIAEVAAAVGYNSPGYFARRFKEKYGIGPKQFTMRREE